MIEQLEEAGAPPEVIEAARKRAKPKDAGCHVWEENWKSFELFAGLDSQWRIAMGMGGGARTGLDYTAVLATLRELIPKRPDRLCIFQDIQIMEKEALSVWKEQQA